MVFWAPGDEVTAVFWVEQSFMSKDTFDIVEYFHVEGRILAQVSVGKWGS